MEETEGENDLEGARKRMQNGYILLLERGLKNLEEVAQCDHILDNYEYSKKIRKWRREDMERLEEERRILSGI